MDKEQIEWQRKIIKEEYIDEPKRVSNDVTLPAAQTLQNRRNKRIK